METNASTLGGLPAEVCTDLARYGIQVEELPVDCIELDAATDTPHEEIDPEGCEVIELPTEVIIYDYPVHTNWCEVVPRRINQPQKRPIELKEVENVRIAC
jgi:hypothetical protein